MLILLAGVAAVSWRNAVVRLFMLAALGNIVVRLANLVLPDATLRLTDTLLTMTGLALLAALVLWQVFLPGRVDLYRILGAIAAYLLIGLLFAQVFRLIAQWAPGAFLVHGAALDYDTVVPLFRYYSFITFTTLGFGDLSPVHPLARSMTVLEALIGVLYPAVLIARLVSLEQPEPHPAE
jgi:Ion channel